MKSELVIGLEKVSIDQIYDAVLNDLKLCLSDSPEFQKRINKSHEVLHVKLEAGELVYGVNTGYGDSCNVTISKELQELLPIQLTRYHRCGLGEYFSVQESKAIQIVRLISLAQGYSGVRMKLLEHMVSMYNAGIVAQIPQEGSVGASGDLTPLSYYAASLIGEGTVYHRGELKNCKDALKEENLEPIVLIEKEALALMNGTSAMTALSCFAFKKAEYIADLATKVTALSCISLLGNPDHYKEIIFQAKPHKGTIRAARSIQGTIAQNLANCSISRIQDRYSLRCAPHVIGVLYDALDAFKPLIETEINSANDNPLIDCENKTIHHGGNFYGGHIAFTMDSIKNLVANVADLIDRQVALVVDPKFNNGLPANLVSDQSNKKSIYHGLKALQISISAWTAEALKNTMPASVFSRSTESHNQDKVSMGTIAARDAIRVIQLTNQVLSGAILATNQAIQIRVIKNELSQLDNTIQGLIDDFQQDSTFITEDRALDSDLRSVLSKVEQLHEGYIS